MHSKLTPELEGCILELTKDRTFRQQAIIKLSYLLWLCASKIDQTRWAEEMAHLDICKLCIVHLLDRINGYINNSWNDEMDKTIASMSMQDLWLYVEKLKASIVK